MAIDANIEHRNKTNSKRLKQLESELFQLKTKEKQIVEKNFKGIISDVLAKELLSDNEEEITRIVLERDSNKTNQDNMLLAVKQSVDILEHIEEVWVKVNLDIKQRFQKFLFPEGVVYDGKIFGTTRLAFCIEPKLVNGEMNLHEVAPRGFEPLIFWMKTKYPLAH